MAEVKIEDLKEISIKKIGCDAKRAIKEDGNIYMCRIGGEASVLKTKEARNGDLYSYLIGEFFAIRADGARFTASKLYLPGGLQERIEAQLVSAGGAAVKFGFDIWSDLDDKSSVGYKYRAVSIIKAVASDRVNDIMNEMEGLTPQADVIKTAAGKEKAKK